MTDYQEIASTIESKGAKLIFAELKRRHRKVYAEYRNCADLQQLYYLQALQKVIDTAIPEILEDLMNRHLDVKKDKRTKEWWHFIEWFKQH